MLVPFFFAPDGGAADLGVFTRERRGAGVIFFLGLERAGVTFFVFFALLVVFLALLVVLLALVVVFLALADPPRPRAAVAPFFRLNAAAYVSFFLAS